MEQKNIFEGALFGSKWRTRDGRMAIYVGKLSEARFPYCLIIEGDFATEDFLACGHYRTDEEIDIDIIGPWEEEPLPIEVYGIANIGCVQDANPVEPASEEKVENLGYRFALSLNRGCRDYTGDFTEDDVIDAYKAGYHQAVKDLKPKPPCR